MAATVDFADVEIGTKLPEQDFVLRRVDLLRYCGACSDFAAIHWNERIAKAVGLPDVIAHGTLTLAEAMRIVTDWVGDPGALVEYSVRRFTRPVVVPDDDRGTKVHVTGVVENKLPDRRVAVRLNVHSGEREVMSEVRAIVQLA